MGNKNIIISFIAGFLLSSMIFGSIYISSHYNSKVTQQQNHQVELKQEKLEIMKEIAFEEKYIYTKDTIYTPGVKTHLEKLYEKLNEINKQIK